MNTKPIEQAQDDDLRLSKVALLRAAQRARELARSTGTFIVISHNGVVEHLKPEDIDAAQIERTVQQPDAPYGRKR